MTAHPGLRPAVSITTSVLLFALLIENAGLVLAVAATALIASLGSPSVSVREALLLAVGLAVGMSLLFVGLLDQPFALLPSF